MKLMKRFLQHPMIYIIFFKTPPLAEIAKKGVK
jgi:hypothetical protein